MILFFAILAALIAAPSGAMAEPISSAIAVALAASSAGAGTFAAIAAGFGALGAFATQIIVGAGLSLLGQIFAKKPAVNGQGIQTEQTTTGDVTPQKFIVGTYAVEGHAVAPAYSRFKNNGILTYILEVSNVPVTGLTGRIIINGKYSDIEAPDNGTGPFNEVPVNSGRRILTEFRQDDTDPTAWLWFYDGTQTAADPTLVTYYGAHPDRPWTTDHVLRGTAYAVLEFALDPEIYQGLPSVRFEVQGIKLYDPRKDTTVGGSGAHRWDDPTTWEFSSNPQVIAYNIYRGITLPTGDIWGGKVSAEDLPLDNWFAAMNECDVLIGDRKQYVAGFEINVEEMEPADVIEEMNRASFAQPSEFGGVFRVRVGAPSAPVLALTDADFVITESSTLTPFPAFENVTNGITGTYVEPNDIWEGREANLILNDDWVTEDGGQRVASVGLPAVSVKAQAQHILNSLLLDARRFVTFQVTLPPSFALVEPLDSISFTSEIYGYTNKTFEVIEVEDRTDTLLQVVVMREREAGDVAWGPELDVPAPLPTNGQTPPSPLVVPLSVAAFDLSDATGAARRPAILLTWTIESLPAIRNLKYQVRVKATQEIVAEGIKPVDGGRVLVRGELIASTQYEVRARYVADVPTAWTAWLTVTTPNLLLIGADLSDGAISSTKFADGIEPITIVEGVLPTVKLTEAIMFESKLYRWNGIAYVATVPAVDVTGTLTNAQIADLAAAKLTGQITQTQITDGSISTSKIAAAAITAAKIAATTITGDKIAANTITAAKIAAGTITATEIAAGTITAAKIAADTITAAEIAAGAINASEVATNAITTAKINGRAVTEPSTFFENYGGGTKTPATASAWNNATSFSIVVPDSGSILLVDSHVNWLLNGGSTEASWGLRFLLDGVAFDSQGGSHFQELVPFRRSIPVSAGTRTLTLECQRGSTSDFLIQNVHTVATILKR